MTKCPECGKELSSNDTFVLIFNKEATKIIGCFHLPAKTLNRFLMKCKELNKNPSDVFRSLLSDDKLFPQKSK